MANYKGDPFVVGSWTLQNGKKVEQYFLSGQQEERYKWKSLGDYSLLGPKESQIRGYGVISLKESVVLFGGSTNEGQFSSICALRQDSPPGLHERTLVSWTSPSSLNKLLLSPV